jgi:rhodanese-related sulfurtransferase
VLFLREKDNKAQVFDPPDTLKLEAFHELVPRWDGNGVVVSSEPIDTNLIFGSAKRHFALYFAASVIIVLIIRFCRRAWRVPETISWQKYVGVSVIQFGAVCVLATVGGLGYHRMDEIGFLSHKNATAAVQKAHAANFIRTVTVTHARKLLSNGAVFVDARHEGDFEAGHLEGAINVPVNAQSQQRRKMMSGVSKDACVVVYCQSKACKFAETVAVGLVDDGFQNVLIFRDGWTEWKQRWMK